MASFEAIYWALPDAVPRVSRERLAYLAHETFPPDTAPSDCAAWCLTHPHAHDDAIMLLRQVHAVGAELAVHRAGGAHESVLVRDPNHCLSAALRHQIKTLEPDMITLLRFGPAWELSPGEFARSGGVARVPLQGRLVLVAADNADPCHPALAQAKEEVFWAKALPDEGRAYFASLGAL